MNPSNGRTRHLVFAAIHLSLAAFFDYAFYVRYWIWRHELAQVETSVQTPDGGNVTSSGMVWILPALFFTALFVVRVIRYFISKSNARNLRKA